MRSLLKKLVIVLGGVALSFVGLKVFQLKISPFDLIIGLPLIFIGAGLVVNQILSIKL